MLEAATFPRPTALLTAESLVAANLRGVDSHGVQLLPYYVEQVERGDMDPGAQGRVTLESGACLLYDGANGAGQQIASVCCCKDGAADTNAPTPAEIPTATTRT